MPKEGTNQRLLYDFLLKEGGWINGGRCEDYMRNEMRKKASTTDRDLRRLRARGLVESKEMDTELITSLWWKIKENKPPPVIPNTP